MAKRIKPEELSVAIGRDLDLYHKNVVEAVDKAGNRAIRKLVKQTRATAPVGERGDFKKSIASKCKKKMSRGSIYVWYVKAPNYRLTHLLVHGHATRNGGRTKANPFLHNALEQVLPEYEKNVKEALKNGG